MEIVANWSAISISAIALVVTLLENRRSRKRTTVGELTGLLNTFLRPLETILRRTKADFDRLTLTSEHDGSVHRLEYFPSNLRAMFERLPDNRRTFWEVSLNQLQRDNSDAVELVDRCSSNALVDPGFREACAVYRRHVVEWKGRWDYVVSQGVNAPLEKEELIADPFPSGFDAALQREIKRISTLASQ